MEGGQEINPTQIGFPTEGYDETMRNIHIKLDNGMVRKVSIPYEEKDSHPVYYGLEDGDKVTFRVVFPDGTGMFDFDLERKE